MIPKETAFNHLRPTTTPEMLDRAFSVAFRVAPMLWGAGAIYAADHLLSVVTKQLPKSDTSNPSIVGAMLALALLGDYAAAVALLGLFQGLIFPRRPLSPKALFRTAFRKLPGFFLTHLLYLFTLIILGTVAVRFSASVPGLGGASTRWGIMVLLMLVGIYIAIRLSLAPIISLIEDTNPFVAFVRSRHLTSRRAATSTRRADYPIFRWFAAAALPFTVALALAALFGVHGYLNLGFHRFSDWKTPEASSLVDQFAFTATFIAMPLYWAGLMAVYVEYRMRHEALDFYLRLRELRRKNDDAESPLFKTN